MPLSDDFVELESSEQLLTGEIVIDNNIDIVAMSEHILLSHIEVGFDVDTFVTNSPFVLLSCHFNLLDLYFIEMRSSVFLDVQVIVKVRACLFLL